MALAGAESCTNTAQLLGTSTVHILGSWINCKFSTYSSSHQRSACRIHDYHDHRSFIIMSKHTFYTNITPLPPQITRQIALDELHNHGVMIKLNPLVIGFERTSPHKDAPPDEFHCIWYEITDKVGFFPGVYSQVKYKACFFDRPIGLQTHCYAPAGLDIKAKWSVGGNMPGEPREARELGVDTPRDGLYLREEVSMRCSYFLTSFVKKNLKNAHKILVDRLLKKVEFVEEAHYQQSISSPSVRSSVTTPSITPGGQPLQYLPLRSDGTVIDDMYKHGGRPASLIPGKTQQQYPHYSPEDDPSKHGGPPPQYWQSPDHKGDWKQAPPSQRDSYLKPQSRPQSDQFFAAELPGSAVLPAELYSPAPSSNLSASPRPPQEKEAT